MGFDVTIFILSFYYVQDDGRGFQVLVKLQLQ
jgi:hypothetical protein